MTERPYSDWAYGRVRERLIIYYHCQKRKNAQFRQDREDEIKRLKSEGQSEAATRYKIESANNVGSLQYAKVDLAFDIISCASNDLDFPESESPLERTVHRGRNWPVTEKMIEKIISGDLRNKDTENEYRSYPRLKTLMPIIKEFLKVEGYITDQEVLEPNLWLEPTRRQQTEIKAQVQNKADQSARIMDGDYRSKKVNERVAIDNYLSFAFSKGNHWFRTRMIVNLCDANDPEPYTDWPIAKWKRKRIRQHVLHGWFARTNKNYGYIEIRNILDGRDILHYVSFTQDYGRGFKIVEAQDVGFDNASPTKIEFSGLAKAKSEGEKTYKFQPLNVENLNDYLKIDRIEEHPMGKYHFVFPEDEKEGEALFKKLVAKIFRMEKNTTSLKTDIWGKVAPDYVQCDLSELSDPTLLAKRMFFDLDNLGGFEINDIIHAGADINHVENGFPILQFAAIGKSVKFIRELLAHDNIDHLKRDHYGRLASQITSTYSDGFEITEELVNLEIAQAIAQGIDPEELYEVGNVKPMHNSTLDHTN